MSEEPKTLADLWFMRVTSSGWFDGQIKFDNSMQERVEGGIHSVTWHVRVCPGGVDVIKCVNRYETIDGNKASITGSEEQCDCYKSLEDFKASEWWEPTMEAWKDGDVDVSWIKSLEVDGEKIKDDAWLEYSDHCIELEVGRRYKDWLGNTRQDEGHDRLSISVDQMSGYLELHCGEHEVFGTVKDLERAVRTLELLKQKGIDMREDMLIVSLSACEEGGR